MRLCETCKTEPQGEGTATERHVEDIFQQVWAVDCAFVELAALEADVDGFQRGQFAFEILRRATGRKNCRDIKGVKQVQTAKVFTPAEAGKELRCSRALGVESETIMKFERTSQ